MPPPKFNKVIKFQFKCSQNILVVSEQLVKFMLLNTLVMYNCYTAEILAQSCKERTFAGFLTYLVSVIFSNAVTFSNIHNQSFSSHCLHTNILQTDTKMTAHVLIPSIPTFYFSFPSHSTTLSTPSQFFFPRTQNPEA